MANIRAFKAVRPTRELADKVAALPYDVMTSDEARTTTAGNPYSFLHVDKAEIDLDRSIHLYDRVVYEKACDNLYTMMKDRVLVQDDKPCLYIYKQRMGDRTQTGLVCCASIDDYMNHVIKKNELTRADKEQDRINHVDYCDANTGPIFLTYREQADVSSVITGWVKDHAPVYDFVSDDGIGHTVWVIDDSAAVKSLEASFRSIPALYIADGHHRTASAAKVGLKRREQNPGYTGDEEFNFFLAVLFPDEQLRIMDYNRVIKDLNGHTSEEFLALLEKKFEVKPYQGKGPCRPAAMHSFGMYLDRKWYVLTAKPGTFDEKDPLGNLDVLILQNNVLSELLAIEDPRVSNRIDFVGGIRGLDELERRCASDMCLAFSMYPTTIQQLIDISDAGLIMPPKSTWFEPKLRSGLFIHLLK